MKQTVRGNRCCIGVHDRMIISGVRGKPEMVLGWVTDIPLSGVVYLL